MRSLMRVRDGQANEIARSVGYSSVEELKGDYVPPKEVRYYDMAYDKDTKEIVLINKSGVGDPVPTSLFIKR